jgi:hypothetical protein
VRKSARHLGIGTVSISSLDTKVAEKASNTAMVSDQHSNLHVVDSEIAVWDIAKCCFLDYTVTAFRNYFIPQCNPFGERPNGIFSLSPLDM